MEPNNYLYYVIQDNEHKVRAHIIGTQHTVDYKDRKLNSDIVNAISRCSQAILEMPPGSKLIPSSDAQWIPSSKWVIDREINNITMNSHSSKIIPVLEENIQGLLKDIKEITSEENYEQVLSALKKIESSEDKVIFVNAILANMTEFNEVSLEENINKIIQENKNCEILPLEDIDLGQLIIQALHNEASETEAEKKIEKISLNKNEEIEENRPQINDPLENRRQTIQKELYKAWMKGETEELKDLIDECTLLYPESPEFEKIHGSRDANIAQRIVDVIIQAKKEDKESAIVVGCAHLLYSKRKNVIEYLNEHFITDLKGWSIKQIKNNN